MEVGDNVLRLNWYSTDTKLKSIMREKPFKVISINESGEIKIEGHSFVFKRNNLLSISECIEELQKQKEILNQRIWELELLLDEEL